MSLWLKVAIIALLGIGLSVGSYFFVEQKLDAEHEQYVRGLVITHSAPSRDAVIIGEESNEDTATSTKDTAIDILTQGQQMGSPNGYPENSDGVVRKRIEHSDLAIEIGIVTFDNVEFQVGESWQSQDGLETYTITKIIKTPKQIQLYYETKDGTEYVFVLDQSQDGNYIIQGADNITVNVETDPAGDDANSDSTHSDQTSTTTQNTNTNNTNTNQTSTSTQNTSTSTNDDNNNYIIIDTSTTTDSNTSTTTQNTNTNNKNTNQTSTSTQNTGTSTTPASTSTTPIISTNPTSTNTSEQAQPYNDGTYQYKANPDYIPYTPPLYDRDYGAEVGVDP